MRPRRGSPPSRGPLASGCSDSQPAAPAFLCTNCAAYRSPPARARPGATTVPATQRAAGAHAPRRAARAKAIDESESIPAGPQSPLRISRLTNATPALRNSSAAAPPDPESATMLTRQPRRRSPFASSIACRSAPAMRSTPGIAIATWLTLASAHAPHAHRSVPHTPRWRVRIRTHPMPKVSGDRTRLPAGACESGEEPKRPRDPIPQ